MALPSEKDRITCHVLDTSLGVPARGVRVQLELLSVSSSSSSSSSASSSSLPASGSPSADNQPAAAAAAPKRTFEAQTDDDGRIKVWLPYSSAQDSGEVPVYTLEDVFGEIFPKQQSSSQSSPPPPAAEGGKTTTTGGSRKESSTWCLRFDTAGYFGGADKTFFPEATVVFTVEEEGGRHYHVPLLVSPYSYTTYRGS